MELIKQRYDSFKAFLRQVEPNNEWVLMLQITSLDIFLYTIKSKISDHKNVDTIIDLIFEKAGIDKSTISIVNLDKFTRYIQYFYSICEVV